MYEGQIVIKYELSKETEKRILKKFWNEIAEKLPEGYTLRPKFTMFGYPISYNFMNVCRKGVKARLGLEKPLMTLYVNIDGKHFSVKCFSEMHLHIIEPIIQTLRKLGYWIFITKIKGA